MESQPQNPEFRNNPENFSTVTCVQGNKFSVMSVPVFLGLPSFKQRRKCLTQGHNHNAVPKMKLKLTTHQSRGKRTDHFIYLFVFVYQGC